MPAGFDTVAGRLVTDQPDAGLVEERVEDPDGVGSSPDAGGDGVGQPARPSLDLRARLEPDDSLKIRPHGREGMRSRRGAETVVRVVGVGNPIPERLVDRVLERLGPALDGDDL